MSDTLPDRNDRAALLSALKDAGARFSKNGVFCPFHENTSTPSGSVFKDDKGVYRYKCFSQCGLIGDVYDVTARIKNISVEEVIRQLRETTRQNTPQSTQGQNRASTSPPPPKPQGMAESEPELPLQKDGFQDIPSLIQYYCDTQGLQYVDRFEYRNPDTGNIDLMEIKFLQKKDNQKTFRMAYQSGDNFIPKAPPKPWPLFNRLRLRDADTVVVTEGCKDVKTLHKYGFVGTTSPGGSKNGQNADWSPLAGKKVILWPDNDGPGKEHIGIVTGILRALEPKPELFLMPIETLELPDKGDVTDYLETVPEYDRRIVLRETLDIAEPLTHAAEIQKLFTSISAGERYAIPTPFPYFTEFTHALKPGTITLLCGDPDSAKSFFLLQCLQYWNQNGYRACAIELEEDRSFHLVRALAQGIQQSSLLSESWVKDNPELVQEIYRDNEPFLNAFGQHIHDDIGKDYSMPDILAWTEERCKEGYEIICVDPITATDTPGKPWEEARKFVRQSERLMKKYGARLIVVTHPKKGGGKFQAQNLDDISGGAAFSRFTQTVLWLEKVVHGKRIYVVDSDNAINSNRILHLQKCRNSYGGGYSLAFNFDNKTLQFSELGLIDVTKKQRHYNNKKKEN